MKSYSGPAKPLRAKTGHSQWTRFVIAVIVVGLLAAGTATYERSKKGDQVPLATSPPVPVIAVAVQQHDVPITLTGLGTVTALNTATIHSQITGMLTSVDFQEGQSVKKGDLLAQIDSRTYQAQLDQAEATLEHDQTHLKNAQLNLKRYSDLVKTSAIPVEQVDNQQAAVEELVAQIKNDQGAVNNAKAQLSYTSLLAPFDGVTGIRLLDVGNIIHPPTSNSGARANATDPNELVVVTQIQPIGVVFTLAASDIQTVQDAMAQGPLQAIALSQDDKTVLDTGKLLVVNNQADPGSGTVQLKAVFPNQAHHLWPGTFVNVRVVTATVHNALTIPLDAVQQGPQGQFVFVVDQNHKVVARPVSVRQTFNGEALISKGLSAGETVVTRGQYRLSLGTLVRLANPNDPAAVPNPSTESSGMLP